ncbi:undecaprenyl/decaprenyl-phosphate alpha-N-acetylglucosaminyl 1-phosphate transferase [Candidatus Microgenomates bacterium]|nr:undecaprenyl/decaprenyl-phosphate alpha-N-acetylglucosaminyl 1-phosphate transferase [Candidatus Microgenomates bacterium]
MVEGEFLSSLPFVLSAVTAALVTVLVIRVAPSFGIVDNPRKRRHPATLHTKPTPRGGGIPIFLALLISTLFFLPLNLKLAGIMGGALLLLAVGVADDRRDVSPLFRLVANIVAAGAVVATGITIPFLTNPFGGIINLSVSPLIAGVAAIFWIVAITNIVSWSSGVDGQLAGFVPIAAATIGGLSLRFAQDITALPAVTLSLIVGGAYLGFLAFSVYPQRIMPGYSGGALAGYLLAVLAIISGAKLATAIIVLGIPVMDALFVILRRVVGGKSPLWADAGHLHHRLIAAGWNKPQVAAFYWGVAVILGFFVLHLNSQAKFYTIVMLAVVTGGLLLWLTRLRLLLRQPGQPTG